MTYTVAQIFDHVKSKMEEHENVLFGLEKDNHIGDADRYLFDSPQGYWNVPDNQFPRSHSWRLFDGLQELIASTEHQIDIVTMDEPTELLYGALRRGLVDIAESGAPATVRILIGRSMPQQNIDYEARLREIREDLSRVSQRNLYVYFGQYRYESASWGHSKFIAVDGRHLIAGGHNLWGHDYLGSEPVFDLSMRYDGPIARGGHRFANGLWRFVKKNNTGSGHTFSFLIDPMGGTTRASPDDFHIPEAEAKGSLPMMWVTNPGWGVFNNGNKPFVDNSFVHAFVKAMEKGEHCRLSQQDIGATWRADRNYRVLDRTTPGLKDYPYDLITCDNCYFIFPIIDAMAKFLYKSDSTRIDLVASPEKKTGRGYTNMIPPSAIFNLIGYRIYLESKKTLSKEKILAKLEKQFHFGVISFSDKRSTWPPRQNPKYNHAKFWMVDDVFHVGSENFYPSTTPKMPPGLLQEFGVIAPATDAVKKSILDVYFTPMQKVAVLHEPKLHYLSWMDGTDEDEAASAAAGD